MEALTFQRAVELAHEIVAGFGEDYKYPVAHRVPETGSTIPTCVYVHEGEPSCLVGQILHRHGVSLDMLSQHEFEGAWTVAFQLASADDKARGFLLAAQTAQDRGQTWGEAVEHGLATVSKYYTD